MTALILKHRQNDLQSVLFFTYLVQIIRKCIASYYVIFFL